MAPRPRAGSSPTRPPIPLLGTQTEPEARLPTFAKEIWAMGAPGWGFFFVEKSGLPSALRLLSQEPRVGEGGPNHSPFQQHGQEVSLLKPSSRPGACPGPAHRTSTPATGPSILSALHPGRDPPGAVDTEAWGRTGRVMHGWPDPLLGHGAGWGLGTVSRWRGAGIRLQGRRTGGGQGRPTRQREQQERRQSWRLTAHMDQQGPLGALPCRGCLPGLGGRGELIRPDHPPTAPARARECRGQEYERVRGRQGRHVC